MGITSKGQAGGVQSQDLVSARDHEELAEFLIREVDHEENPGPKESIEWETLIKAISPYPLPNVKAVARQWLGQEHRDWYSLYEMLEKAPKTAYTGIAP